MRKCLSATPNNRVLYSATGSLGLLVALIFTAGLNANSIPEPQISLEESIQWCLNQNLQLRACQIAEESGRAGALQSAGAFLPRISYAGNCTAHRARTGVPAGGLVVSQTLLNPALFAQRSQGQLAWLTAALERIAAENELICQVRSAYYSCVLRQAQRQTNFDLIGILQRALQRECQRFELGQSTSFEIDQARVALARAITRHSDSCQGVRVALDHLASLLGMDLEKARTFGVRDLEIDIEAIPGLRERLDAFESVEFEDFAAPLAALNDSGRRSTSPELVERAAALALRYQPRLRIERLKIVSALASVRQQWSQYSPQVTATYARNQIEPHYEPWRGRQKWSGSLNFTWTLFDGAVREQGLRAAQLKRRAQELKWSQQRNDLALRVREQFDIFDERALALAVARAAERLAKSALDQAQVRRQTGQITSLDFRLSAQQFAQARLSRLQAIYDAAIAQCKLEELGASGHHEALDALGDERWPHE